MVPKQAWERLYVFMVRERYEGQMSGGGGNVLHTHSRRLAAATRQQNAARQCSYCSGIGTVLQLTAQSSDTSGDER